MTFIRHKCQGSVPGILKQIGFICLTVLHGSNELLSAASMIIPIINHLRIFESRSQRFDDTTGGKLPRHVEMRVRAVFQHNEICI